MKSDDKADSHDRRARELTFGAELIRAGASDTPRTRFRLWAPSRAAVRVEFEYEGSASVVEMTPTGDGWFEGQGACGAGTRYRYRLDGDLAVPDPASRFQPDDVHGPSEVIDPLAYRWQHPEWRGRPWEQMVIYELHVGALGGYANVARRLPQIAQLGATAIELMPLNDFSGRRNWGYDGVLPYAPDSAYGRPEDLKALIDRAHELGLAVLIDVVYNHFGADGNYLAQYAKAFFREDVATPWGPAIDFRRTEVREFFLENALYWLHEYRFDGLRLDAVHAINDDGWLRELSDRVRASTQPDRHIHLVLENERNTASLLQAHFDAQWNDDAHNTLHVLLTGEHEGYYRAYSDRPIAKLARVLSEGFVYQGEPSPIHDGAPRGEPSAQLPPTAFVMFLQNHDQIGNRAFGERLRTLCAPQALLAAAALLLLSPQIPMLFREEEFGSTQPFLYFTDYAGELAEAVREGRRREFAKFSAFTDPERRARIPDPNAVQTFALSSPPTEEEPNAGRGEREAWLHFYRSALAVRAKLIAPRLRGTRSLDVTLLRTAAGHDANGLLARWRLGDGETLSIALNLSSDTLAFDQRPDGRVIFETPPRVRDSVEGYHLPGYSCVAWLSGDVNAFAVAHAARARAQGGNDA